MGSLSNTGKLSPAVRRGSLRIVTKDRRRRLRVGQATISVHLPTLIALAFTLQLAGTLASAQDVQKDCAAAQVQLIRVAAILHDRSFGLDAKPEIAVVSPFTEKSSKDKTKSVVALGPILGSMDSAKVEAILTCTEKGFVLTAIITRSADYAGSATANIIWRPKIEIAVAARRPSVIAEATWRMRLSNGNEVRQARVPGYPDQLYPYTVKFTLITAGIKSFRD